MFDKLILDDEKLETNLINAKSQCDVNIYPENYLYPYSWENWEQLFEKNGLIPVEKFKNTISVHFYGKFSSELPVKISDNTIYGFFASKNVDSWMNLENIDLRAFNVLTLLFY